MIDTPFPSCIAFRCLTECRQTRRPSSGAVHFKVGDVIRHRRYHYRGVIYGWDAECKAEEDWMQQMRIDQLPGMHAIRQPPMHCAHTTSSRNVQSLRKVLRRCLS